MTGSYVYKTPKYISLFKFRHNCNVLNILTKQKEDVVLWFNVFPVFLFCLFSQGLVIGITPQLMSFGISIFLSPPNTSSVSDEVIFGSCGVEVVN